MQAPEPELVEVLEAIDATLAGEAVDPRFAEIAELSLLLAAERPVPIDDFARELDRRVARRFAPPVAVGRKRPARARAWLRSWSHGAIGAASAAAVAGIVAVLVVTSGSGGGGIRSAQATSTGAPSSAAGATLRVAPTTQPESNLDALRPPSNGRPIVQSATLALGVDPKRIDDVAQELFNVVGSVDGMVENSNVTSTGGPDGNAQFALRVPSSSLAQTMAALSRLRYANVASRTDTTQDVGQRFQDARRRLADARALRVALLKQLASATTSQQITSLKAQIATAESTIASVQAGLTNLSHQVAYSRIDVTIQASAARSSGGAGSGAAFGLGRAAHDALRVLTVAAAVALIALAALVPAGLVAAIAWWTFTAVRRRRREHALDMA